MAMTQRATFCLTGKRFSLHRLTAPLHVEHEIGFERIEFHFIKKASKSPNLITKFVSISWFVFREQLSIYHLQRYQN